MNVPGLFAKTPQTGAFVKICGVTNALDAHMVVEVGADAIGVNLFSGSKRYVPLADCQCWLAPLAGGIVRVAVVVNPTAPEVRMIREAGCFDAIQFHGTEDPAFCSASGFTEFIKAIPMRSGGEPGCPSTYDTPGILLDAWSQKAWGGTGRQVNWEDAREFVRDHPEKMVFLAGGLNPKNVQLALQTVRPYAVDVASGVETRPGIKDGELVRAFVHAARAADLSVADGTVSV